MFHDTCENNICNSSWSSQQISQYPQYQFYPSIPPLTDTLVIKAGLRTAELHPTSAAQAVDNHILLRHPMQRTAIRLLRAPRSVLLRPLIPRATIQRRNMSEIKKVFTENACPRKSMGIRVMKTEIIW
jgi:hypothetical protein